MKVGTKSVLFGAHCFFIHPWFVALAWRKLYGWQHVTCPSSGVVTSLRDWRLWLCFMVHDWGYWACPDMDGPKGEQHPQVGARIVHRLLDRTRLESVDRWDPSFPDCRRPDLLPRRSLAWRDFVRYHSRFLAKLDGRKPSALCMTDKLSLALTPAWLYVPLARLSGEIQEYRSRSTRPENSKNWQDDQAATDYEWWRKVQAWTRDYVAEHKDGKDDTWTKAGS